MTYRFIDPDGREISVEGDSGLRKAIQEGRLQPDCLMFQADTGKWAPATGHPAYQRTLRASWKPEPEPEEATPHHVPSPEDEASDDRSAAAPAASDGEQPDSFKLWQWLSLASLFLIALFITSDVPDIAERVGAMLGTILFAALAAGLFLVWSKHTRPYLPFAMLGVTLLALTGNSMHGSSGTSSTDQQFDELEALIDRVEEDYGVSRAPGEAELPGARHSPSGTPPPASGSGEERALWVSVRLLEEFEQMVANYEAKHRIGYEHVQGWLEPHYFSNASQYPEIPGYLDRNRAFLRDLSESVEPRMTNRMDELMDQANLPVRGREEFEHAFLNSLRENSIEQSGMADLLRGFTATAEELHQVLVANEHLIQVNPSRGVAEIRDAQVEDRALNLVDELDWYIIQIAELQDELMRNMRGVLEEGRAVLR